MNALGSLDFSILTGPTAEKQVTRKSISSSVTRSFKTAWLQRYLNGRFVSFDVDKLLSTFEPFHQGISDRYGTVPLQFPGYPDRYELRLGPEAVERRVTSTLTIRLPIHAPGFWFCVHCLMVDDYVALFAPTANGIYYVNARTPDHVPTFTNLGPKLSSLMKPTTPADTLIKLFVDL